MFRPLLRRPAPFPLVLGCSRPLVGTDAESSEVAQETPRSLFSLASDAARSAHKSSEHDALRQSHILHARHKSCDQEPPPAHNRLDALTSRLHIMRVKIGNRVVRAIVLSPTDAASRETVVGSAQRVVEARALAPREAAAQHFVSSTLALSIRILSSRVTYTILSTCPLHSNSGCGKREAYINWSMVTCQGSTRSELP